MNKSVIVIYHDKCDDGMGAALAAFLKFGDDADYVPANYGDSLPDLVGKDVYIFDFSYSREKLLDPSLKAKSITMLDHHKSALEEWGTSLYYDSENNILVGFNMSKSGAMLAWEYLHESTPPPLLIQHVQDNDLWKFSMKNTKPFIRNLRSYPQSISSWVELLNTLEDKARYEEFVSAGESQERLFNSQVRSVLNYGELEPVVLGGVRGLAINSNYLFSSELGNLVSQISATFGLVYFINEGEVICSLRSQSAGNYDVSILSKIYGGGGHKNAAGMRMPIKVFMDEILCRSPYSDLSPGY